MDNIIIKALSRLFDLMLLNFLWILFSLPIITIGASTTALYSVMLKIIVNEEGYIIQNYLKALKKNFKQSTIIWAILLVIGIILWIDMVILFKASGTLKVIGMIIIFITATFYLVEIMFVFPLISRFENTTANMIKNALLIPIARLPYTLLIMFMTGSSIILTFFNYTTMMVGAVIWSVVGVSVLTYANSFFVQQILKPFE